MKKNVFDLSGRVAVVVGTGAFGTEISQGFAEFGADVVCADFSEEAAKNAAGLVEKAGRKSLALRCNVGVQEDVDNLVARTMEKFGTADILVNGVALGKHDRSTVLSMTDWENCLNLSLTGTFRCCQGFGRIMEQNKSGSIINISSIIGIVGSGRGHAAYASAKGGINGLTRELAIEWAKIGIRVNAIAPCQFDTPSFRKAVSDLPDPEGMVKKFEHDIPVGRLGRPEEIVGPAVFLASDASSMVTGHILSMDGGFLSV